MINSLIILDGNLLLWIQRALIHDSLTPFFSFVTRLGNQGAVWIAISIILLIFRKTRHVGIILSLSLIGSLIINNLIFKNLIERTRPYDVVSGVRLLIERQTDFSFPSGHTGSSFAAAIVLLKELPKKYGIPAVILATFISISRIYLGVHYPSDVLFGAVSGCLIAIVVRRIYYIIVKKKLKIRIK